MADAPTTTPTKEEQLLAVLAALPKYPQSGFKSSEFAVAAMAGLGILGVNLPEILYPGMSASAQYALQATVALFLLAGGWAFLRFVLKQSNINLLAMAVTAYGDVVASAKLSATNKTTLPDVPAGLPGSNDLVTPGEATPQQAVAAPAAVTTTTTTTTAPTPTIA